MNAAQKVILAVGGTVLLANLLYPPWEHWTPLPGGVMTARMSRAFILDPPKPERNPDAWGQPLSAARDCNWPLLGYSATGIDWPLLGGTSLPIVAATAILVGVTSSRKKPRPN